MTAIKEIAGMDVLCSDKAGRLNPKQWIRGLLLPISIMKGNDTGLVVAFSG
ncbi:hypothetical protein MKW94_026086 [Papaver nudicaule]|uniref:Uncharacterized protein n=1 Tax=Papaver nudicaule TaxID=74823 RepID=A0AA41SI02_PAPNU|nr:hypothetical protein [Papaver nudicaule]